jgi:hypothetical protein
MDSSRPILLRHVITEFLTSERISKLVRLLLPSEVDSVLWSSLCSISGLSSHFLTRPCENVNGKRPKIVRVPTKVAKSMDGIIGYIADKHGGNVSKRRIVRITSKSVSQSCFLNALADLNADGGWSPFASDNGPGEWICCDFCQLRLRPTHYTIMGSTLKSCFFSSFMARVAPHDPRSELDYTRSRGHLSCIVR